MNGVLYVGSNDFNVYAINAATGKKIWSCETGGVVSDSITAEGISSENQGLNGINSNVKIQRESVNLIKSPVNTGFSGMLTDQNSPLRI